MANYMEEYQKWLDSPSLTEEEWSELNAISDDETKSRTVSLHPLNLELQACAER